MSIEIIQGDLWSYNGYKGADGQEIVLAHGVNCAGAMGAGIAVQFKKKYPKLYSEYNFLCKAGQLKPGQCWLWQTSDIKIFNLAIKDHWRNGATYEATNDSFESLATQASELNLEEIAMPFIGTGLGGLPMKSVAKIINKHFKKHKTKILIFAK